MTDKEQKDIGQVLEECLERIRQGASLEDALRRHPDHAAELRPLLEVAMALENADFLAPSHAARQRMQARFEGAVHLRAEQKKQSAGWLGLWTRPWAMTAASIGGLFVVGSATLWASTGSLPNQPLYGVKRAAEGIEVAMARSPQDQAQVHLALADKRMSELARLAQTGDAQNALDLTAAAAAELRHAQASLGTTASRTTASYAQDSGKGAGAAEADPNNARSVAPKAAATPSAPPEAGGVTALTGAPSETPIIVSATADTAMETSSPTPPERAQDLLKVQSQDGWNLISLPDSTDRMAALAPETRAFVLQVQEQATRNLAVLYFLKLRAPESARPALDKAINLARNSYNETLQSYLGPAAGQQMDVRERLWQIDAPLTRAGSAWMIAGRTIHISATDTRVLNAPESGKPFRVSGVTLPNGTFLALFVERGTTRPAGQESTVDISGQLAVDPSIGGLAVGGFKLLPVSHTQLEGMLKVGAWARATGALTPDGLNATRISVTGGI